MNTQQIEVEIRRAYPHASRRWRRWLRSPDGREALAHLRNGQDVIRSVQRELFWRGVREYMVGLSAAVLMLSGVVALLVWLTKGQP